MYVFKDIAFILHPKTGSHSIQDVLDGWEKVGSHHEVVHPLPKNVISVIRETSDWFVSWYWHNYPKEPRPPFGEWLENYTVQNLDAKRWFYGLRYTTHVIFFDKLEEGINAAFADLGLPPVELEHLNHKGRNKKPASDYFEPYMYQYLDPHWTATYETLKERCGDEPYYRVR